MLLLPHNDKAEVRVFFVNRQGQEIGISEFLTGPSIRDTPDADAAIAASFGRVRHVLTNLCLGHYIANVFDNLGISPQLQRKIKISQRKRSQQ